ncbi:MAG: hypothetical protein DCC71_22090, partial [Proteobacteria bacterium]
PGARVACGAALGDDGGVRASLAPGADLSREVFDFDPGGRLVRWALAGADGEPLLEARYGEHRPLGADSFAYDVELLDHATQARARVGWLEVELNPALPPELFALPAPSEARAR